MSSRGKRIFGEVFTFILAIVVVYLFFTRTVSCGFDGAGLRMNIEVGAADGTVVHYLTDGSLQSLFDDPSSVTVLPDGRDVCDRLCNVLSSQTYKRNMLPKGEWPGGAEIAAEDIVRVWLYDESGATVCRITLIRGEETLSRIGTFSEEFSNLKKESRYSFKDEPTAKAQLLEIIDSLGK